MKTIYLGKLGGLTISAKRNIFIGIPVLWAILAAIAYLVIRLSLTEALIGGLIGALLHILFEMIHQFGHAIAARGTGYPMIGMRFWWVLAASIYPSEEPQLPAATHIRRALGGPIISGIITLIAGLLAWLLMPTGGLPYWLALFAFLDSLFVFTIGALLPLGFTDGSTLLRYWGKP